MPEIANINISIIFFFFSFEHCQLCLVISHIGPWLLSHFIILHITLFDIKDKECTRLILRKAKWHKSPYVYYKYCWYEISHYECFETNIPPFLIINIMMKGDITVEVLKFPADQKICTETACFRAITCNFSVISSHTQSLPKTVVNITNNSMVFLFFQTTNWKLSLASIIKMGLKLLWRNNVSQ